MMNRLRFMESISQIAMWDIKDVGNIVGCRSLPADEVCR